MHEIRTDIPKIEIYKNRTENRITLEIKTGYCLKLLTPEKLKLFGSNKQKDEKIKITKMYLISRLLK